MKGNISGLEKSLIEKDEMASEYEKVIEKLRVDLDEALKSSMCFRNQATYWKNKCEVLNSKEQEKTLYTVQLNECIWELENEKEILKEQKDMYMRIYCAGV